MTAQSPTAPSHGYGSPDPNAGTPVTTRSIIAWLPAVIAFATFVSTLAVGLSQLRTLQAAHEDVAKRLETHAQSPGHTETVYRANTLETTQGEFKRVLDDHEKADKARDARLDRVDLNVLLICQATRGAACVKP